jgi:hypothetical protein
MHYCGTNSAGKFTIRRQTARKRLEAKLQHAKQTLRIRMHEPVPKAGDLETGMFAEAERHLRFALKAARVWFYPELTVRSNFVSYTLAQFYLGRVLEQTGRKAEAISSYKEFLSHFENSTAKLPQIAEARAALKRLM